MSRMFLAPSRYVQGAGAIAELGIHAARMGTKALFTGGKTALNVCGSAAEASLKDHKVGCHTEVFKGECSYKEIRRLMGIAKANRTDLVIAAGGGKVIDTGKAVGHEMKIPVLAVPTIAATDAPCSALSVIYSEHAVFERYLILPKNPDCVLVDTTLVANAPVELLVSGMGDALATYWEADTCAKSHKPNALTGACPPTLSSLALARLCYDTLLEYGLQAKLAVEKKSVTPAVEAVVEANILLSGLGFESGGLAGAHAVHNGLTVLEASHAKFHGQKVAFGVITQMVLEGRMSKDVDKVLDFYLSVGLPVCLEDLSIYNPNSDDIRKVAEAATVAGETIHSTWFPVTVEMVESAIWAADALGRERKSRLGSSWAADK
ncbi:MAG: glycerol dehydrogenase [Desulfomonile tiedjei]|uniref:Glycerol dehydrogenase n=1 Tax=Desulfomonile tiedjei TaxID=2358 RepID=A0A9D6UX18_9BACT|nr:glycerol dehydrogenase [Desulfomonile tiedjei]